MSNCLKCSSYNDRKGICEITEKSVSPSDTCERADAERLPTTYNNTCSSCKHFNSSLIGGYCQYHRADTQGLNGCSDYEELCKEPEQASQTSQSNFYFGENESQFGCMILFLMGAVAVFIDLMNKYPYIVLSAIFIIITILLYLYSVVVETENSKILFWTLFVVTAFLLWDWFGGDVRDFIFKEKDSLPKIYHI